MPLSVLITIVTAIILICYFSDTTAEDEKMVVACAGDSITAGNGPDIEHNISYPAMLQHYLGHRHFAVKNFGLAGVTAIEGLPLSYSNRSEFNELLASSARVVLIMLGTNDANERYWNETNYIRSYSLLIDKVESMASQPVVFMITPPPFYLASWRYAFTKKTINSKLRPLVVGLARRKDLSVIDAFDAMGGDALSKPSLFGDGCHPSLQGMQVLAEVTACPVLQQLLGHGHFSSEKRLGPHSNQHHQQHHHLRHLNGNISYLNCSEVNMWFHPHNSSSAG